MEHPFDFSQFRFCLLNKTSNPFKNTWYILFLLYLYSYIKIFEIEMRSNTKNILNKQPLKCLLYNSIKCCEFKHYMS